MIFKKEEKIRLGKPRSEETKMKISEYQNRPEVKRKKSELHKGKKHIEEHKIKMSESWKNRKPVSEETKRKMSEVQKGRRNQESLE